MMSEKEAVPANAMQKPTRDGMSTGTKVLIAIIILVSYQSH